MSATLSNPPAAKDTEERINAPPAADGGGASDAYSRERRDADASMYWHASLLSFELGERKRDLIGF